MKYRRTFTSLAAAASAALCASAGADLSTQLGVAHVSGAYYFTPQDYLDEGARQVINTGSKVLKLEMDKYTLANTYSSTAKYPWNASWPAASTLTDIAKTPYFSSVFSNPNLSTYVLTTYSPNIPGGGDGTEYWLNGMTASQKSAEKTSFYNLTKYLMQTYNGTGKTFSLENWEGDWALRDPGRNTQPSATAVQGMIDWINAREAGIRQARTELGNTTDVKVYGTLEVNLVADAMLGGVDNTASRTPGWKTVTNDVLPFTNVDLASYSSYDTQNNTSGTLSFSAAANYIAGKLPPSVVNGQNLHSVGVGEFGIPEDSKGISGVNTAMNNVVNTVTTNGMPYAVYWEIYSNELQTGATAPANGNDSAVKGFWMIKPDGTPGQAWHQYRQRIITSDPTRATTTPIKTGLTEVYQNNFTNNGGSLPSYWTINNAGGTVTTSINSNRFEMKFTGTVTSTPFAEATLNLTDVLGRGLKPGEYAEFTLRRENNAGIVGLGAFGLHHGSAIGSGTSSPLQIFPINGWVPFSTGANGATSNYNFDSTRTIGMRLDSADGHFATVSYYIDGGYSGSWIYQTTSTTLTSFSLFAQDNLAGAGFEFDNLNVYAATLPGDANLDGRVNAADFTSFAQHFHSINAVWMNGDFNSDGIVNALDFNVLASNFGSSMSEPALGGVVPEPALWLTGSCLFAWSATARRRRI